MQQMRQKQQSGNPFAGGGDYRFSTAIDWQDYEERAERFCGNAKRQKGNL